MLFLILGMHKSGTTLIAETLMRSGINMGFDLKMDEIDYSNQKCEGYLLREINNDILNSHGKNSLKIKPIKSFQISEAVEKKIHKLIVKQTEYNNWGMKDPRLVLTYDVWKKCLDDFKLIVIIRNPVDVVMHYIRDYPTSRKLLFFPYYILRALSVWRTYNIYIEKYLRDERKENYIILNYSKFIKSDTGLEVLSNFVGKELIDARTKTHNKKNDRIDSMISLFTYLISVRSRKIYYKMSLKAN